MENKVIVITGASQGLGKELSFQLAKLGARLALVARNEKLLKEVKDQIISSGGTAEYFVCDISDYHQVSQTVTKIIEKFNHVDVLINNAGVWISNEIAQNDKSRIESAFKINSVGQIYFSEEIVPLIEKQNFGHFVFINSIAGLEIPENKNWRVYSATKWALSGYSKSLLSKFSGTPIKVSSIHPGPINTEIDSNAGDEFGDDHSSEMTTKDVAKAVVNVITAPDSIQFGTVEFKKTNWNQ